MSTTFKLSKPRSYVFTGKFCLPVPVAMTGIFSAVNKTQPVTSITQAAGVATVTIAGGHGYLDGDIVFISGASPIAYNGPKKITVVSSTVFTFSIATVTGSPATGTILASQNKAIATGLGTKAGVDFQRGDLIYMPEIDCVREVGNINNELSWEFTELLPGPTTSAAVLLIADGALKGASVQNVTAASAVGVLNEAPLIAAHPQVRIFDQYGIGPVYGDAQGASFKVDTQ